MPLAQSVGVLTATEKDVKNMREDNCTGQLSSQLDRKWIRPAGIDVQGTRVSGDEGKDRNRQPHMSLRDAHLDIA